MDTGVTAAGATWDIEHWREGAACHSFDTELFFPSGTSGPAEAQTRIAKAVCAGCPVRNVCLEFAVVTNQEYGVWGGYDEEERRVIRRSWRARMRGQGASCAGGAPTPSRRLCTRPPPRGVECTNGRWD
ncbi:MAG: WhiB family transcriptional regulator, redox-sensing transcriptional regulator, partial [Acidimicrobiaceae bacterium]|nr:WhiB family transcriptional regulator, redox-sensing transcriptional regulator [Acidimicrobiaceae bacterium]